MKQDFRIPDFERYTNDQQFINVAGPLMEIETNQGGLKPEEIWELANKLLESLKNVPRPEITIIRLFTYLVDELGNSMQGRSRQQLEHTAYCIIFCVGYILCSNDEDPNPNQEIINSIRKLLQQMPDIQSLFYAVKNMEDEQEAKGYTVKPRNFLSKETADIDKMVSDYANNEEHRMIRAYRQGWVDAMGKATWNEDDERILNAIINDITIDKRSCKYDITKSICEEQISWLKSLKQRIKR